MKRDEMHVGQIVELVDSGGRRGKRLTNRKVRIEQIGVSYTYSGRNDGIRICYLTDDENGMLTEMRDHSGEPRVSIAHARELISLDEANALRAERERRAEELRIKQAQRKEYEQSVAAILAMTLDSEDDAISVSARYDEEQERWIPWRVTIDADTVDEIVEGHNGAHDRPREGDTVKFKRQNRKQVGQIAQFFSGGKLARVDYTDGDGVPSFVISRTDALTKVEQEDEQQDAD